MPDCHTCHRQFENWQKLALHISLGSCKGKRFAAHVLQDVKERKEIKKIPVNPDYVPTEFGNENRRNAVRELCGEQEYAGTICPTCRRISRELLPQEFVNSKTAWLIGDKLAVNCQICRRRE